MIRDPFDIHRRNLLQTTASRAAHNIRQTAAQVGANALDMSFSVPRNVPNFTGGNRDLEDNAWSSLRGAGARVQDRVTGIFDKETLPMYKDKPYSHTPSYRNRPWWRKKRVLGIIALAVLSLLHLTGLFSSSKPDPRPSKSWLSWMGTGTDDADWEKRRSHVVEAFEITWDAYEHYAWGRLPEGYAHRSSP